MKMYIFKKFNKMAHGIHSVKSFLKKCHISYQVYLFFWGGAPNLFNILWLPQGHCSLLSLDEAKDIFIKSQFNFLIQHLNKH